MAKTVNDSRPLFGLAIATVFGVGYAPVAPGTFGSAAGLGFLSALFSRDHRGLHDRFAGTRVVRASV